MELKPFLSSPCCPHYLVRTKYYWIGMHMSGKQPILSGVGHILHGVLGGVHTEQLRSKFPSLLRAHNQFSSGLIWLPQEVSIQQNYNPST
jgi:hypothetical protein